MLFCILLGAGHVCLGELGVYDPVLANMFGSPSALYLIEERPSTLWTDQSASRSPWWGSFGLGWFRGKPQFLRGFLNFEGSVCFGRFAFVIVHTLFGRLL